MTNKERAKNLVDGSQTISDAYWNTERALDEKDRFWSEKVVEAEKRGAETGTSQASQIIMAAYVKGQKEMRKRAASESQKAEYDCYGLCAKLIHALPIIGDGEEGEK